MEINQNYEQNGDDQNQNGQNQTMPEEKQISDINLFPIAQTDPSEDEKFKIGESDLQEHQKKEIFSNESNSANVNDSENSNFEVVPPIYSQNNSIGESKENYGDEKSYKKSIIQETSNQNSNGDPDDDEKDENEDLADDETSTKEEYYK